MTVTCRFLSCSASTSARTDLVARVTLALLLTLTLAARALPGSGSFSVLESSKLARLALLLNTQSQPTRGVNNPPFSPGSSATTPASAALPLCQGSALDDAGVGLAVVRLQRGALVPGRGDGDLHLLLECLVGVSVLGNHLTEKIVNLDKFLSK